MTYTHRTGHLPMGTKIKPLADDWVPVQNMVIVGKDLDMYVCVESDVWPLPPGDYISFVLRDVDFTIVELIK